MAGLDFLTTDSRDRHRAAFRKARRVCDVSEEVDQRRSE
jgi:hypothetical protein